MNPLIQKLERAIKELDEARKAVVSDDDVERAARSIREGASAVADEADELFTQIGRQTYDLIERGKLQAPEPLRPILERIQSVLEPVAGAPQPAERARPAAPRPAPAPPKAAAPEPPRPPKPPAPAAAPRAAEPPSATAAKPKPKAKAAKKAPAAKPKATPKPAAPKPAPAKKPAAPKAKAKGNAKPSGKTATKKKGSP